MNSATDPQAFHLRPRFTIISNRSIDELCDTFRALLLKPDAEYSGKVRSGFVSLYPKSGDRHYWSPHFSLSMEEPEDIDGKTFISGIYGPAPEVWTMFVFFYAIIALSIVIASVIGFANRSIGESGAILWAIPVLVLIFASMYSVSYFGQKKGHNQVEGIYRFLSGGIED
ncbi:MAG: hypothetical protein ACI9P5_003212 [Saprospiraceae bacterium]|jgi:hypothetical protein